MYSDMKKVYTIILYEKTGADFKNPLLHGAYIHHGKTRFNTELTLELLQEYFLIALDVFCQNGYTDDKNLDTRETIDSNMNDLEGWLSILTAETIADVERVIRRYPWSETIFREISTYVNKPEEVIHMFSEALKIADKNTVKYMIEELQDELMAPFYDGAILYQIIISYSQLHRYTIVSCVSPVFRFQITRISTPSS